MSTNNNDDTDDVFVYMGEGTIVPKDVVRVRVHTSVTALPTCAFENCITLKEVELFDGLLSIGLSAFQGCLSLKQVHIPSTVTNIGHCAFHRAPLLSIHLPNGIERIGNNPFSYNNIRQFRSPTSLTTIPQLFCPCNSLFSFELFPRIMEINSGAFMGCRSLRNLALPPPNSVLSVDSDIDFFGMDFFNQTFANCDDLKQLFGSGRDIFNALRCRFDNLPIHKMLYYQSYNNVTTDQLNIATDARITRRRKTLDPTDMQQDCLGMTPLHILACSTVQNIQLYKVLVDKYPKNLITEDRWGASPLLYALWGTAPDEIVQFLVKSCQSIYPDYKMSRIGCGADIVIEHVLPYLLPELS